MMREKDRVQAVRVNRGAPSALLDLARFYLEEGRPAKALPLLERALRKEPKRLPLLVAHGRALKSLGRIAGAPRC